MDARISGLMLLGLGLWTAVGIAGLLTARIRGEDRRFRSGLRALGVVWAIYLAVLVAVSLKQSKTVYVAGKEQCFGKMCFAVTGSEELPGFWARGQDRERLLRVAVRVTNRGTGDARGDDSVAAYLMDGHGRRWEQVPGLGGVRMTVLLPAGASSVSEPVFRIPKDADDLRLVLCHTRWTVARLEIGNAESWLHRPAEMAIPPAADPKD